MFSSQACERNPQLERGKADSPCLLVACAVDELRFHPSYVSLDFPVSTCKLSALAERGEQAFREPLAVTRDRIVMDGDARLEPARLNKKPELLCIE
jgi:hypothetical protein